MDKICKDLKKLDLPIEIRYFAFTVKILSRKMEIDEKSYEPFFSHLYKFGKSIYMRAEMDGKQILHYHGIVALPKKFYRKRLTVMGFHLKLKNIWSISGWTAYMNKSYLYSRYDQSINLLCDETI